MVTLSVSQRLKSFFGDIRKAKHGYHFFFRYVMFLVKYCFHIRKVTQ